MQQQRGLRLGQRQPRITQHVIESLSIYICSRLWVGLVIHSRSREGAQSGGLVRGRGLTKSVRNRMRRRKRTRKRKRTTFWKNVRLVVVKATENEVNEAETKERNIMLPMWFVWTVQASDGVQAWKSGLVAG